MIESNNNPAKESVSVIQVIFARLRFVSVFVVTALVVGYWDNLKNHIDKWTRPPVAPDSLLHVTASSIEYYCPMHPDVIRDQPGLCPKCGMPLVKRKKGEAQSLPPDVAARVTITPQRKALAGIATSLIAYRPLYRDVHSVGVLDFNETNLARISARIAGRADELFVQFTGQAIKQGDPLYSLYSPDVYTAQREYLLARKRFNALPKEAAEESKMDASAVYNASMQKLVLWGVAPEQLDKLDEEFDHTGKIPTHLTVTSPISGIVVRKEIEQGRYLQVGDNPYIVADLTRLWLQLKLYERDVPLVAIGDEAEIEVDSFPNQHFKGLVTFKAFQVDPDTRTLDARVEIDNPGLALRPGMFASATVRVAIAGPNAGERVLSPATTAATRPASATHGSILFHAAITPYMEASKRLAADKSVGVAELLRDARANLKAIARDAPLHDAYDKSTALDFSKDRPIEELRTAFTMVSAAMIEAGRQTGIPMDDPSIKIFRCPMKNANWLQEGDTANNPYYGSQMLDCGSPVAVLPKVDTAVPTTRGASAPAARVLSVPRSAVIDTGSARIVYAGARDDKGHIIDGVYDMKSVKLGPLAEGDYYPVYEGLKEGDSVVTVGTFLIDAENRLNPAKIADVSPSTELMKEVR